MSSPASPSTTPSLAAAPQVAPAQPEVELNDTGVVAELRDMQSKDGSPLLSGPTDPFTANAPRHVQQVKAAATNPAKLVFAAHAFRGVALNLGAICQEIGSTANLGTTDGVDKLRPQTEHAYGLTLAEFDKFRSQ